MWGERLAREIQDQESGQGQVQGPQGDQGPGGAAVAARTLRWADEAASRGDYADALGWIEVVRATADGLPGPYERKRVAWLRELRAQHAADATGVREPSAPPAAPGG